MWTDPFISFLFCLRSKSNPSEVLSIFPSFLSLLSLKSLLFSPHLRHSLLFKRKEELSLLCYFILKNQNKENYSSTARGMRLSQQLCSLRQEIRVAVKPAHLLCLMTQSRSQAASEPFVAICVQTNCNHSAIPFHFRTYRSLCRCNQNADLNNVCEEWIPF